MGTNIISKKKFKYIDTGNGKPIVLLHGLMGSLSNFKSCIETLPQKGFRVIMPILPIYDLPLLKTSAKQLSIFLEELKLEYMLILKRWRKETFHFLEKIELLG